MKKRRQTRLACTCLSFQMLGSNKVISRYMALRIIRHTMLNKRGASRASAERGQLGKNSPLVLNRRLRRRRRSLWITSRVLDVLPFRTPQFGDVAQPWELSGIPTHSV